MPVEILVHRATEIIVHAAADASMSQAIFSSSHKHLTNTTSAKRLELGGAMVPRILRQATMKIPSRTRQPVASRYQSTTFVHLGT